MFDWYEARVDIPELEKHFNHLASKYANTIEQADIDIVLEYLGSVARALLAAFAPGMFMTQSEIRRARTLLDANFNGWPKTLSAEVTYSAGPLYQTDVHCEYTVTSPRDGEGHTIAISLNGGDKSWHLSCNCMYDYPHFYIFYQKKSEPLAAPAFQVLD